MCAAAVTFTTPPDSGLLADSKAVSEARRNRAASMLQGCALYALGWADPAEIDAVNILEASLLAMRRALDGLRRQCSSRSITVSRVLVDGNKCPSIPEPCYAIVRGDATVPEIQAASILAKVARDRWIVSYDFTSPRYEFALHKGYPTRRHRELVALFGPDPIHRRSFRGVGPAQMPEPPGGPVQN